MLIGITIAPVLIRFGIGLAIGLLLVFAWIGVSACMLSSEISQEEEAAGRRQDEA
jgi:hypothetical protein